MGQPHSIVSGVTITVTERANCSPGSRSSPFSSPLHTMSQHSRNKDFLYLLPSHHCLQFEVNPHIRSSMSWSQSTFAISFPKSPLHSHPNSNLLLQHHWPHCLSSRGPHGITFPCCTYADPPAGNGFPSSSSFKAQVITPLPGLPWHTAFLPCPPQDLSFLLAASKPCASDAGPGVGTGMKKMWLLTQG